jgi:hypothetical protein
MRFLSASVARISTILVAMMLAGCSGASQSVPQTGQFSGPLTVPDLRLALEEMAGRPRAKLRFSTTAKVGIWISSPTTNYLIGVKRNGRDVTTAIDTATNGCYTPLGIKVDRYENLWVACNGNPGNTYGLVQKYPLSRGSPSSQYEDVFSCGNDCTYDAYPEDTAIDAGGHVYATNVGGNQCMPSCYFSSAYPLVWWDAKTGSPPVGIKDPDLSQALFLDADKSGNVYVDGEGCINGICGVLVDEISNPTSKTPVVTNLLPPMSDSLTGVYVSNEGAVLNVTDATTRTTAQYALPYVAGEEPFNTLGPTQTNQTGDGEPISGGFNKNDSLLAVGDYYGWIDLGRLPGNSWTAVTNVDLTQPDWSAAYIPSDK